MEEPEATSIIDNVAVAEAELLANFNDFLVRMVSATVSKADLTKILQGFNRQEAVHIISKFLTSTESSVIFVEDATMSGGDGNQSSIFK